MYSIRSITLVGMSANILMVALKFAIGLLFSSQACVADAVHSLADLATDVAVLVGVRFWSAPADSNHPHGHQRIESIITMFIGILLGFSGLGIALDSIEKIGGGVPSIPGWPVFWVAVASIVCKEILYHMTVAAGRACKSSALMASAWHHRSDAISSIPVAIVAVAARLWPNMTYLDHIAAVIVSSMLLRTAWKIAWPCLQELSDQGVTEKELAEISRIASSIPGIREVHELRTRRIGQGVLLDMHVLVDSNISVGEGHRICEEAETAIKHRIPVVVDVLTHMEPLETDSLKEGIAKAAWTVLGVKDIHGIRIRKVLSGYDCDLHVKVEPSLTVAEGHEICNAVRDAVQNSGLNVVNVLTHLEPFRGGDSETPPR